MKQNNTEDNKINLATNLLVLIFSVYGIYTQRIDIGSMTWFQKLITESIAPVQSGFVNMQKTVSGIFEHYFFLINTSKENIILNEKIQELQKSLFEFEELKNENIRLKKIFQFSENIDRKKILAQVIGWDSSGSFRVLRINKGSSSGIKTLSPVITLNGLVGYIFRVTKNYSDILTILDPNNRVDSIITRTRSHGVLEGSDNYQCQLKYVIRTEEVLVGDEIMTAGLGNIYPKGIKLGVISDVDKENFGITQSIKVTPSVDFNRLEEVLVLINEDNIETAFPAAELIEESINEI